MFCAYLYLRWWEVSANLSPAGGGKGSPRILKLDPTWSTIKTVKCRKTFGRDLFIRHYNLICKTK